MTTYKMTKSELTDRAKSLGYCIRIQDGEIETYPKGMRGDASIFEHDDADGSGRFAIIATIKADRTSRVAAKDPTIHIAYNDEDGAVLFSFDA